MKTYKNIILQMVFLLLLSHLSFSQEVEVNLGGNSTSDAFVVKDSSGNVLLKMDGAKNFGINSEQPDRIEIKEKSGGGFGGSSISITPGGMGASGNINISSGWAEDDSGDINIITHNSKRAGNINITTGHSNTTGGKITIGTQSANGGGSDIAIGASDLLSLIGQAVTLKTRENADQPNAIRIETGYSDYGWGNIELIVGSGGEEGSPRGILLNPNVGLVEVIGSGTYTGSWTQASDERYKNNIKPLLNMLNSVMLLQPVNYEWNKEEFSEENFPDGKQIGLIAQEIEKLFPEIVATNQDGYKSVDYSKLSVLLLQSMKEQQNEIEKQSDEISEMKSDIEELKLMILQESNKFSSNEDQQEVN